MRVSHLLAAAWVVCCWSSASIATTIRKAAFDELCARADAVFVGTVTSVEARRVGSTARTSPTVGTLERSAQRTLQNLIYTYTTFDVAEWIVGGDGQDTYTLATLGGSVGDETLLVHGMPRFEIGGRYILFIRHRRLSVCPVIGWHQGCFRVEQNAGDAAPVVRTYDRRRIAGVARGDVVTERASPSQAKTAPTMTLDRFIAEIRGRLARAADRVNSGGKP